MPAAVSHVDAAAAAGRAARVAVVERAPEAERGGATRYTSSWFRITEDRRLDPNFVDLMESVSGRARRSRLLPHARARGPCDARLPRRARGRGDYFKQPFPNRNTGGGLGMPVGGGIAIVEGLGGILERTDGVELLYETEAVRLERLRGGKRRRGRRPRARRAAAHTRRRRRRDRERGLRGQQGDADAVPGRARVRPPGDRSRARQQPGRGDSHGDGGRRGYGRPVRHVPRRAGRPAGEQARSRSSTRTSTGSSSTAAAERFFDEGQEQLRLHLRGARLRDLAQPGARPRSSSATRRRSGSSRSRPSSSRTCRRSRRPRSASSRRSSASILGALERTVSEYNAAVGPEPFDPYVFDGKSTRGLATPKSNWAFPLDSPPYIAYPLTCAITFTFGGIRTDSSARVVSPAGHADPRPLCRRRGDRPLLPRVPGRHLGAPQPHVRAPRRSARRGKAVRAWINVERWRASTTASRRGGRPADRLRPRPSGHTRDGARPLELLDGLGLLTRAIDDARARDPRAGLPLRHATNPCGGLGLTSGLLDAVQLGDALAAAHAGAAEEPPVQFRHVISATNDSEEDA